MLFLDILNLVVGLVFLFLGGEALVRGATRVARLLGISPLIVGLTIVSIGTSAPEAAVGLGAVLSDHGEVATGNIIGSNICNILLVLGLGALIVPFAIDRQLVRLDVPAMIVLSFLFFALGLNGQISRLEGILLLGALVLYLAVLVRMSRRPRLRTASEQAEPSSSEAQQRQRAPIGVWLRSLLLIVVGLVLLAFGGDLLVDGAVAFAVRIGVSELVIGLSVVAVGTSLPEVITTLVAVIRGQRDMAVGNVVGSNIMNLLLIGGVCAVVSDAGLPIPAGSIDFDLPFMIVTAIACLPIFLTGYRVARWEGALFLGYYGAYLAYVVLDSRQHDALPAYARVMWTFVIPLTAITLAALVSAPWLRRLEKRDSHQE